MLEYKSIPCKYINFIPPPSLPFFFHQEVVDNKLYLRTCTDIFPSDSYQMHAVLFHGKGLWITLSGKREKKNAKSSFFTAGIAWNGHF